jgi:hypothetical protein
MYVDPQKGNRPRANATIVSYSASVVKFYNATSSPVGFENKILSSSVKNALAYVGTTVLAL